LDIAAERVRLTDTFLAGAPVASGLIAALTPVIGGIDAFATVRDAVVAGLIDSADSVSAIRSAGTTIAGAVHAVLAGIAFRVSTFRRTRSAIRGAVLALLLLAALSIAARVRASPTVKLAGLTGLPWSAEEVATEWAATAVSPTVLVALLGADVIPLNLAAEGVLVTDAVLAGTAAAGGGLQLDASAARGAVTAVVGTVLTGLKCQAVAIPTCSASLAGITVIRAEQCAFLVPLIFAAEGIDLADTVLTGASRASGASGSRTAVGASAFSAVVGTVRAVLVSVAVSVPAFHATDERVHASIRRIAAVVRALVSIIASESLAHAEAFLTRAE